MIEAWVSVLIFLYLVIPHNFHQIVTQSLNGQYILLVLYFSPIKCYLELQSQTRASCFLDSKLDLCRILQLHLVSKKSFFPLSNPKHPLKMIKFPISPPLTYSPKVKTQFGVFILNWNYVKNQRTLKLLTALNSKIENKLLNIKTATYQNWEN